MPAAIVTDNGAAYRSAAFARYIASRPEFTHVRTRHRSPQTNGVIERFFQSLKYEYLYRQEIGDGATLAAAVACHQTIYNDVRPHEAIGFRPPSPPGATSTDPPAPINSAPELSHFLDTGHCHFLTSKGLAAM